MTDGEKPEISDAAFSGLLGRLARVPKEELQAEEAKYRAMRERLKEKGETKAKSAKKA
ncbi:MAG: hypothetical protein WBC44_09900 [Planctomycetaceae bacterium]